MNEEAVKNEVEYAEARGVFERDVEEYDAYAQTEMPPLEIRAAIEDMYDDGQETVTGTVNTGSGTPGETEQGNAERLVAMHGQDIRFCHPWGKWLVYDGVRWKADGKAVVVRMAKEALRAIYNQAADCDDTNRARVLAKWATKSMSDRQIKAMLNLAKSEPGIAVTPDELDSDSWLLNCLNGTVDLRTGELRKHGPKDLITKLAPVCFDPEATRVRWREFLRRVTDGNAELIEYLQSYVGYCLTGDISEQILVILYGKGANGKSVFLDTIREIMGDYAAKAPPDLLTVRRHEEHPTQIAALAGKRLIVASETEEGRRLKTQFVKESTGDATMRGRYMRQDYFEFPRTHKTVLATNAKPVINDTSHAMWRRIRLVPFAVRIPDDEQDKQLTQKMRDEWPGILAWMVQGCRMWQQDGLTMPSEIELATKDYRAEQDMMEEFLEECCIVGEGLRVSRPKIWRRYQDWLSASGERSGLSKKSLYDRLRQRGFGDTPAFKEDGQSQRGFSSIDLRAPGA